LCISIERIYVPTTLWDQFVERFVAATKAMKLSPALDYSADMGSLISEAQFKTVAHHVDDAVGKGATVLAGGRARPDIGPYFYDPTILSGVHEGMAAFQDETFGPVVSLYPVDSEEEAIEKANDSAFGLNFSVWTSDPERGRRVATRLQAGTVNVNEAYAAAWGSVDAPMGGMKDSGVGRRHGEHGILKYTESQTIATERLVPVGAPTWMPADRYARTLTTGLRALRRLPGGK
jgi:succinate-semialdehyde dehydrogenase/glutarate-semialdehyde dehydrogenase